MLRVLLIVAVVVLIAIILAGVALIRDYWRPLKDSNGQPVELDSKQKSRLKIMMGAAAIALFTIFLSSKHNWVKKMKRSMGRA